MTINPTTYSSCESPTQTAGAARGTENSPTQLIDTDVIRMISDHMALPAFMHLVVQLTVNRLSPTAVPGGINQLAIPVSALLRRYLSGRLIKDPEAAERLGVSVKTLQNMRAEGRGIPYCKPFGEKSRAVRYDSLELELLIASRRVNNA